MSTDTLVIFGAIAGLAASFLAIVVHLLDIRARRAAGAIGTRPPRRAPARSNAPARSTHPTLSFAHLVRAEVIPVVAAGLILSYLGLAVAARTKSILYLDMTGTALAAFLLGPWWGAITGLLSNSLVNWLLFPEPRAELIVFPWSLVNMAGGLYWGWLARTRAFKDYAFSLESSALANLRFFGLFGVLGAGVMSVIGSLIQRALGQEVVLALDPSVASAVDRLMLGWHDWLQPIATGLLGERVGSAVALFIPITLQNWLRYIPDKTVSVAISLVAMRYGFPLFARELVSNWKGGDASRGGPTAPLLLGSMYLPSYLALRHFDIYHFESYWPVWSLPWLVVVAGAAVLVVRRGDADALREAKEARAQAYRGCLKPLYESPSFLFFQRLNYATLAASLFFIFGLPLLEVEFYRVAFNFLCVVYGFLAAMHLVRISLCQNVAVAWAEGRPQEAKGPSRPRGQNRGRSASSAE